MEDLYRQPYAPMDDYTRQEQQFADLAAEKGAPKDTHSMDWGQLASTGASMFGGGKVDPYPTLKPQSNTVQSGGIGKYRSALMSFL